MKVAFLQGFIFPPKVEANPNANIDHPPPPKVMNLGGGVPLSGQVPLPGLLRGGNAILLINTVDEKQSTTLLRTRSFRDFENERTRGCLRLGWVRQLR